VQRIRESATQRLGAPLSGEHATEEPGIDRLENLVQLRHGGIEDDIAPALGAHHVAVLQVVLRRERALQRIEACPIVSRSDLVGAIVVEPVGRQRRQADALTRFLRLADEFLRRGPARFRKPVRRPMLRASAWVIGRPMAFSTARMQASLILRPLARPWAR
jgi:hypothetical protein